MRGLILSNSLLSFACVPYYNSSSWAPHVHWVVHGRLTPSMRRPITLVIAILAAPSPCDYVHSGSTDEGDWSTERERVERDRMQIDADRRGKTLADLPRGPDSCHKCHQDPEGDRANHHLCKADCAPYPPPPPPAPLPRLPRTGIMHYHFELLPRPMTTTTASRHPCLKNGRHRPGSQPVTRLRPQPRPQLPSNEPRSV